MSKLVIKWTDHSNANLADRVAKLKFEKPRDPGPRTSVILFLRGAGARASQILPALYTLLGSGVPFDQAKTPHWRQVQAASLEFSSQLAVSLCCRAVFDESNGAMTGKRFASATDATLDEVAEYWAQNSGRPMQDARIALELLRSLFKRCSRQPRDLLKASSLLERRVGLLKLHANRHAAHMTLEDYLFGPTDVVHVVAAMVIAGAIIVDFDRGEPNYFDSIDEAGWRSAKQLFPELEVERIFGHFSIHQQAAAYCRTRDGLDRILNGLPAAIGWWDSEREAI